MSLKYKLILCSLITVVLTAILPLYVTYVHQKETLEIQLQEKLKAIVASSSQFIDGDLHGIVRATAFKEHFPQDEFDEILETLQKIKSQNKLEGSVYTMRPYDKDTLEFVVMTDKDENGDHYTGNLYRKEAFHEEVLKGNAASSPVYSDSEGTWISAASPIYNSENKVIGLLQTDYEVSHYYNELYSYMFDLSKLVLAAIVFCLFIFIYMVKRISTPLKQLTDATIDIAQGKWEQELSVNSKDEIGTLAENFIKMKDAVLFHEKELKVRELEALKAKEEAEEASKAKSAFLAVMSHEIRTPMNGVIASAELLNESELDSRQKDYLYTLRQSADLQLRVINDILDFSKLDSDKMSLEDISFDLHKLISDITDIQKLPAGQKGLSLSYKIDSNVPQCIQTDPIRVRQMILNVTNNSIKFTEKGTISIHVSYLNNEVLIEISDTGIGISEDKLEGLFAPFSQADFSISRKYGGTGLGLSICKKIANLLNGKIRMTSKVDVGTSVYISFPVTVADQPSLTDTQFCLFLPDLPKIGEEERGINKVLIVEDNLLNQKVTIELLRPYNFEIIMAENGIQALKVLKEENVDLILMDCMMPVMDGYEATRIIREKKLVSDKVPIVALTANTNDEDVIRCTDAGMNDFIGKPATRKKFQSIMEKWFPRNTLSLQNNSNIPDNKIILLVEDNKTNLLVAQQLLAKYSYNIMVAENGKEAIEILKTNTVDMILMDCMMPVMDGYEATVEIRKNKLIPDSTPIVALTANTSDESREKCQKAGMDDFISKPADRARFDELFDKWFNNKPAPANEDFPGKKILLVEDHKINQVITAKLLEKYSHNIQFAADGVEALLKAADTPFDLVFMDCMMPGMDGYEATVEMRENALVSSETPIIALTANTSNEDRERCRKSGMNDFVTKPVTREALDQIFDKWCKQ